ncbi:unnamed protein product [Coffea canephora]|uniref:Uncharacterized protein n=1 Tax=Coffea canephora TaxID=49390 RepID=A0A068TSI0_COFCA|nr:unnamed protein product [Coffea canephora]
MEEEISALASMLLDDDRKYRVVSICGMGGLECSVRNYVKQIRDLAYRIENIVETYAAKVASKRERKDICSMLKRFACMLRESTSLHKREVVEEFSKVQKVKSCLVVVDDIWRVDDWNSLRPALPIAEASLSKISSRYQKMATICCIVDVPSRKHFAFSDSIKLINLLNNLFSDSRIEPKLVEDLGREMVAKCGHLPLAISVIGGILREKNCLDGWKKVHKGIDSYLRRSESSERYQAIDQELTLIYDDLPYHLKPCFLYTCHYPEDKMIQAEELCLCSLMDVAERYFNELASRSLVQVQADEQFSGSMQFCRLHDLMRELCPAKSEEEEFFQMMSLRDGKPHSQRPHSFNSNTPRRLVIYKDHSFDYNVIQESAQQLRSLLLFSSHWVDDLLLPSVRFNELPQRFGSLLHLRFLCIKDCGVKELPSSICDLPFLRTRDLRDDITNEGDCALPNASWKLKQPLS